MFALDFNFLNFSEALENPSSLLASSWYPIASKLLALLVICPVCVVLCSRFYRKAICSQHKITSTHRLAVILSTWISVELFQHLVKNCRSLSVTHISFLCICSWLCLYSLCVIYAPYFSLQVTSSHFKYTFHMRSNCQNKFSKYFILENELQNSGIGQFHILGKSDKSLPSIICLSNFIYSYNILKT